MTLLRRHLPALLVALLALASTITSLGHDFTYDDRYVILGNDLVHHMQGLGALWRQSYWPAKFGSDGYRPIVMTLFTLEWVAGNGAAWVFHLVNIALTVAVALAVRWCAAAVLPAWPAFAAGALFAVHPVHVEVTGNIVGQSELVVALCLALAIGLYLRRRLAGVMAGRDAASIVALFGIAMFAKEHALVLPAILVAAELTVIPGGGWRRRARELRPLALGLIAIALAFFWARAEVQRSLAGFDPFPVFRYLKLGMVDRQLTMMSEIPRVARLLVFPTHMRGDYSPTDVMVARGFDVVQLPGLMITFGVVVLAIALRRRAPVASFGLLWLMIAYLPVSNLLIPVGFIVAERTLFFPSVGVVLVAGAIVEWALRQSWPRARETVVLALLVMVSLGTARSIGRQRVWKNNDIFLDTLVRDAPLGYRAHFIRGRHLQLRKQYRQMELEYRRAIRLFPYDAAMTLTIADSYARSGVCKPAVDLFEWTYSVTPEMGQARYQYVWCLAKLERWADVRRESLAALNKVAPPDIRLLRAALVKADSALKAE